MKKPARSVVAPTWERVAEFESIGVTAFTTTRAYGDMSLADAPKLKANTARWERLRKAIEPAAPGLASALQVHGSKIAEYTDPWTGWTRGDGVDAHLLQVHATAAAVTVADCVPVFIAHPSGDVGIVHAGWRGTAARFVERVIARFVAFGAASADLHVHLGPAICGRCYEVGPDVYQQLTGWETARHRHVDLRALLSEQSKAAGVRWVTASAYCTRCDNDRFYSHRAGDAGRQISVILSPGQLG